MLTSLLKLNAALPALLPAFMFMYLHRIRHETPFVREEFLKEYDYIVGMLFYFLPENAFPTFLFLSFKLVPVQPVR